MLIALRLSGMLVVGRGGVLLTGAFGARRVLGMSGVFFRVLGVDPLIMRVFFADFFSGGRCRGGGLGGGRILKNDDVVAGIAVAAACWIAVGYIVDVASRSQPERLSTIYDPPSIVPEAPSAPAAAALSREFESPESRLPAA